MSTEIWVESHINSRYIVSNTGYVFDTFRRQILAQTECRLGYLRVKIHTNNGRKTMSVSRLIAGAFFDYDISNKEINHIDGNKHNNHIANLEICDRSENMLHAFSSGLARPIYEPFRVRIVETDEVFNSTGQIDRYLGLSSGSVSKTLRGLQPTAGGYTFERVR